MNLNAGVEDCRNTAKFKNMQGRGSPASGGENSNHLGGGGGKQFGNISEALNVFISEFLSRWQSR